MASYVKHSENRQESGEEGNIEGKCQEQGKKQYDSQQLYLHPRDI